MDKIKRFLPLISFIFAVIAIVCAVLVFAIWAPAVEGLVKVLVIILGIVMILFGVVAILYAFLMVSGTKPNFFLYEQKSDSNMNAEMLEFSHVNAKMTYFLTLISDKPADLWNENIIGSNHEKFGEDDLFRPLVAYKMLYALVEHDSPAQWQWYLDAEAETIESLADALSISGDDGLANAVKKLHSSADGDYAKSRKFLTDNKSYIEKKMLKYVKSNIDKF